MKKLLQSLFLITIMASQAIAQDRTVTGTVTASEDGITLPGVSVIIKGTKIGSQTGPDGRFSLNVPSGSATLTFSYIGYITKEVNLGTSNTVNVILEPDNQQLSEVVVTGYGTQARKDVTGSISSVSGEKLRNQPIQSFEQALQGKAAGVNIIQPNGVLNNPPVFRIRGFNSLSLSSYPLVVIDGVPVFTGNVSENSAAGNALGDINPSDIESIDILKDAAASSIYGSRAGNGVVLITTKRGKKGNTKVNYEGWAGFTSAQNLPELLNAEEYVLIKNESRTNIGQAEAFFLQKNADGSNVETNWYDIAYRNAVSQNHALNFSGATDKTSYYVSVGYSDQEGFIEKNSFTRKVGRVNLDHALSKKIKIGTNFSFSNTMNIAPNTGSLPGETFSTVGLGRLAIVLPPNVAAYNADGSYNVNGSAIGLGANTIASNYPNAATLINEDSNTSENNRLIGSIYGSIEVVKGLTFKTNYGIDNLNVDNNAFTNRLQGDGFALNGSATSAYDKNERWNWYNTLNYNTTFSSDHSLSLLGGYEEQYSSINGYGATRQNVNDPFIEVFQGAYSVIIPANLSQGENTFRSFFGSLNYDFKKKYFIGGSFRRDGYSGLSSGNKYGDFGGASAGWTISEEGFFKNSKLGEIVSNLKIRGSYGVVGNINIGNFPALSLYAPGLYGPNPGLSFNQAGNANLQWESSKKKDIGLQLGFLGGRIDAEFAYYQNDIDGLIQDAPQSPSKGIPNNVIRGNIGSM